MDDTILYTGGDCSYNGDIPVKEKAYIIGLALLLLTASATAESLTLGLEDGEGNLVGAEYRIYQDGNLQNSSTGNIDVELNHNENYTVKELAPTTNGWYNTTYYNLNITQNLNPDTQLSNLSLPNDKTFLTDLSNTYTVQTENLSFEKAKIRLSSSREPNRISHCLNYDFQASKCNSWEVNSTADYSSSYSSDILEFNVTEFDGYSAGRTAPYPNVTEIRIYDVSDTLDNRNEGILLEEGLNKTFNVAQYGSGEYRFEFRVYNNGSENWQLLSEDELFEEGLDSTWSVSDIWYYLGETQDGGSFSGGKVSWDTGNGGELETTSGNETLTAKFVIDLTLDNTKITDNLFKAFDTSEGTGSTEEHEVRWKKLGDLNVTIHEPPNGTVLPYQEFSTVNATVECLDGKCGEVKASTRHNSTDGYQLISEESGEPFYTNNSNEKLCGVLESSESCSISWKVNTTGEVESWHKVDVNASSNYTEIPERSSSYSEVQINKVVIMNLSWSETDFGYIDPGEEKPAEGNDNKAYNITIGEKSTPVDGLWLKGNDLVSVKDDRYRINISNVTMTTEFSSQNFSIQTDYQRILSDISPGTSINTRYWLDAPLGITQGAYKGNITFKANSTT